MNARLIVGSAVLGFSLAGGLTTLDAAHASPSLAHRMMPVQSSMTAPRPDARIIAVRKAGGEGHVAIIAVLGKKRASSSVRTNPDAIVDYFGKARLSPSSVNTIPACRKAGDGGYARIIAVRSPLIGLKSPLIGLRSPLIGLKSPLIGLRSPLISLGRKADPSNHGIISVGRKAGGDGLAARGSATDIMGPEV